MAPIDYGLLRFIWWAVLGLLLIGFAVMDGFDLGSAILLPYVARTDQERRVLINTIAPVWEGNQVWFVLGGGAAFAAWPPLYATAFSGFYLALFLVLVTLILRPVALTFRSKIEASTWRRSWDWAFFTAGLVPSLIFGVAFGNLFLGVPFHFDDSLRMTYEGGLLGLLNPFALICGLLSVAMLTMHGGTWLALKTTPPLARRAQIAVDWSAVSLVILFSVAGLWIALGIDGYVIQGAVHPAAVSNPLAKEVARLRGAWLRNYGIHPLTALAPIAGYLGALAAPLALRSARPLAAFVASALSVASIVATAGLSLFPFLMPSSSDPRSSLTVWDSSSSAPTLFVMLIGTLVFLPLILAYTGWVFHTVRGKVTVDEIKRDSSGHY